MASVAVSGVVGIFIYRQFKEMAAQTKLLSDSAQQARIDAAQSSLATAKQQAILQGQLDQQQAAVRLEQRAWVTFSGVDIIQFKSAHPVVLNIKFTNIGKTPALDVRYRVLAGFAIRNDASEGEVIHRLSRLRSVSPAYRQSPIAPQETKSFGFSKWSNQYISEIPVVGMGMFSYYVHGKLEYRDVFKQPQWVTFCFRIFVEGGVPGSQTCPIGSDMSH